jgi:hypothetical protein
MLCKDTPEANQFFNVSKEIGKKQRQKYKEKLDRIASTVKEFANHQKEFKIELED